MLESDKPLAEKRARKEQNRGRFTTEIMEQHIWKEFPEELFGSVLARLPIATFFRFRSVCQKWNSILNSQSFHQQCAEVPQLHPWVYTTARERNGPGNVGAIYDHMSKKWHHPIIHAFPYMPTVALVASAGGLVCFVDTVHNSFYVCNPLTKSCRELLLRSVKYSPGMVVGMSMNEKSRGGYKIIPVNCDGEYEVYDSRDNSWSPGSVSSNINLPLALEYKLGCDPQPVSIVSIGSTLYFTTGPGPDGIVSYDMVTREWKQYLIPDPLHLSDYTLAECEGRLLLVGNRERKMVCVCLWELQKMAGLWKEVDRMPNALCSEIHGMRAFVKCLGNKGLIMLSLWSFPNEMSCMVTYDFSTKEWAKFPDYVVQSGRNQRLRISSGVAFYPSLTALA